MATPMRSLTLPIGLKNSSLNKRSALTPAAWGMRAIRTSGVSPIVLVMELYIRPRPGLCSGMVAMGASPRSLNDEVGGRIRSLGRPAVKAGRTRALANVFDRDFVEFLHHVFLQRGDERYDHKAAQLGTAVEILFAFVQAHGDAHDIAHTDAPAFARQPVAAARAAHTLEDTGAHEL